MPPDQPHHPDLWRRSETRLLGAGLTGVAAVYLGFLGVPVSAAETFVKRGGYYVMFLAFALFLHALWRWARTRPPSGLPPLTRRQGGLVAAAIGLGTLAAVTAEPFRCKILYDEFVLQSTAFNMHFFRDVATMVRGYDIQGVFLSTDNYLDKRPYFYPFLVSLVHDLTGYRPLNAFLVNAALMPVSLALAFAYGRRLAHWAGGLLAVLLLATLPLLGQNATGSGMELLNVVMILTALLLATEYLRAPGEEILAALLFSLVLLAQARYESALYVAPAGLVMLLGWWRAGRIILPWSACAVPLLLVPVALQNKVLSNSPILWELTEEAHARFSLEFLPKNLQGCANFLFNTSWQQANSLFLTLTGLAALAWSAWRLLLLLRNRPVAALRTAAPASLVLLCFGLATLGNVLLVFCYYWSNFDDPMAARFALPLYLLLACVTVLLAAALDRRLPATRTLLVLAAIYGAGVATTRYANHFYSHLGIDEIEWARRTVALRPPAHRLVITNRSTLPWLLDKTPSILIDRARMVADRLQAQLHDAEFAEILVLQTLPAATPEGDHQVLPAERLAGFHLDLLAERRFGTKLVRLSRLVSIDDSALPQSNKAGQSRP
ncbi:MAG: glycosyltransferase family 39 protein [Opitutales bacterium]